MRPVSRHSRHSRSWTVLAAAFVLASVAAWWLPAPLLDWQPALARSEPWRAFTAAWVHWSPLHLAANLLGALVVAALGRAARLSLPATLAWAAAWPLTQAGLLVQPALAHYGGLSGVLHAGVAVAALWLLVRETGVRRTLGAAIATGLLVKLLLEEPWSAPMRLPGTAGNGGWDISTAPLAHTTGAVAGLLCAALSLAFTPRRPAPKATRP